MNAVRSRRQLVWPLAPKGPAVAVGGAPVLRHGGASSTTGAPAPGELPVVTGRLVCVFLRGGMDGMSAVAPLGDPRYGPLRPTIAVPEASALALDSSFGLHPALAPLYELYQARQLSVVHAVSNGTSSRSHFEAQAQVELGGTGPQSGGWLTRHLASTRSATSSALRAIALSALTPASLQGCGSCISTATIDGDSARLGGRSGLLAPHAATLGALYGATTLPGASAPALEALQALEVLAKVKSEGASGAGSTSSASSASNGAATGAGAARPRAGTTLAAAFADVASVFRADVGVEVCCVDAGGWDTHNNMGTAAAGQMHDLLAELGTALAELWSSLRDAHISDVTVVVLSEFGRRAAENGSGGLDHGSGNVMFVLGNDLAGGGTVRGSWPGLSEDQLVRGDLRGTTDYRSVLVEVLAHRLGVPGAAAVFPGAPLAAVGAA